MSITAPLAGVPPVPPPVPSPVPSPGAEDLDALRAELDRLDDGLHDALMRRAAVVERIAALGSKGRVALRPGREAAILRRLLARHAGRLPARSVVRLWRELFAGTTAMQGTFGIAVCDDDPACPLVAVAREQFGALTPLRVHPSPAQAIAEVGAGAAGAAVLPLPVEDEPATAAWWLSLLQRAAPRIHVVARLPFWTARPDGAPKLRALVASANPPDPSGDDRTLLGLEIAADVSRARLAAALAAAGFSAGEVILRRAQGTGGGSAGATYVLADVAGFIADGDPRLLALPSAGVPPVVLGAYAVPVPSAP